MKIRVWLDEESVGPPVQDGYEVVTFETLGSKLEALRAHDEADVCIVLGPAGVTMPKLEAQYWKIHPGVKARVNVHNATSEGMEVSCGLDPLN